MSNIDTTIVTVNSNENPIINLEISAFQNEVDVAFVESLESIISIHNLSENSHPDLLSKLTARDKKVDESLSMKVDIIDGKSLSTNDLTNTLKSNYDNAYNNIHAHNNKTYLDLVSGINTGDQDLSKLADINLSNITSTAKTNLNNAGVRTIVSNYLNGSSWYRVWSDGWIEQGGRALTPSAPATVTLLKPFSNTNYLVLTSESLCVNTSMDLYFSGSYNFTTNSFSIQSNGYTVITWLAFGY